MPRRRLVRGWIGAVAVTAAAAALAAQTGLRQFGLTDDEAGRQFVDSVARGSVDLSLGTRVLKPLAPEARAQAITAVAAWARAFAASAGFRTAWAAARDAARPEPRALEAMDLEMKEEIEEMKKLAATLPPEQRKAMEEAIKQMIAMAAERARDPELQKQLKELQAQQEAALKAEHAEALQQWEQDYPADPSRLIARHLRAFLDACADVDFDARLVERDGRRRFVNQTYEEKPWEWKLCFRTGREATTAARTAATAWLQALPRDPGPR